MSHLGMNGKEYAEYQFQLKYGDPKRAEELRQNAERRKADGNSRSEEG